MVYVICAEPNSEVRAVYTPISNTARDLIDKLDLEPEKRQTARIYFRDKVISEDTKLSDVPGLKDYYYVQLHFSPSHHGAVPFNNWKYEICCNAVIKELCQNLTYNESALLREFGSPSTRNLLERTYPQLKEDHIAARYFADLPSFFSLFQKKCYTILSEHAVLVEALYSVIARLPMRGSSDQNESPKLELTDKSDSEYEKALDEDVNSVAEGPSMPPAEGSSSLAKFGTVRGVQMEWGSELETQQDAGTFDDREGDVD